MSNRHMQLVNHLVFDGLIMTTLAQLQLHVVNSLLRCVHALLEFC